MIHENSSTKMAAASSRILAITLQKCDHVAEKRIVSSFSDKSSMQDVYEDYHPSLDDCCKQYICSAHSELGEITTEVTVGEIAGLDLAARPVALG